MLDPTPRPPAPVSPAAPPEEPDRRRTRVPVGLLVLAAAVVLVTSLVSLVREAAGPEPLTPYVAPQYWLSFEHGFVRRGLPGELARLLAGGRPPGYDLVQALGVALSVLAVLAVLGLALLLARRAADRGAALAVAAAVVVSPLGLSLYARDLGRSDAIGVVALVAVAALPWGRWRPALALPVVAVVTSTAVAAEEFMVALVLPLGLLVLVPALAAWGLRRAWAVPSLLPCALLAVYSALTRPSPAVLAEATAAARAAGVPPSLPLVPGQTDHDAVSRLGYGFRENVRTYYSITTPEGVLATTLVLVGLHLLVLGVVWRLLGGGLTDRAFVAVAGLAGAAALALSVAGIDYRRWWSLAVVAGLAALLRLAEGPRRSPGTASSGLLVALVVLAVAGVALQTMPLWPIATLAELRARVLG